MLATEQNQATSMVVVDQVPTTNHDDIPDALFSYILEDVPKQPPQQLLATEHPPQPPEQVDAANSQPPEQVEAPIEQSPEEVEPMNEQTDEADIRWLVNASENKFRRMSRDLRQLKKKEYAMKGHHLPVER